MKEVKLLRRNSDASFVETKSLNDPHSLEIFEGLWNEKKKLGKHDHLSPGEYPYSLVITAAGRRENWLYHPSGLTQVLSKSLVPVYRIDRISEWHALLGIHSENEAPSAKADRLLTWEQCESRLRETLTRALESRNAASPRPEKVSANPSIAELEKLHATAGPSSELAIKVLSMKDPHQGRTLLTAILHNSEGLLKIHAAAVLALLGFKDGVSALRGVETVTSSQVEFFYAKAALLLLKEPIPPGLAGRSSVFPDYENLVQECLLLAKSQEKS